MSYYYGENFKIKYSETIIAVFLLYVNKLELTENQAQSTTTLSMRNKKFITFRNSGSIFKTRLLVREMAQRVRPILPKHELDSWRIHSGK